MDGSWSGEIRVRQTSNLTTVEAFEFKGEMITSVSRNSTGDRWLFSHTTIHTPEVSETPRPYLSLWNWPLRNIEQKFEVGLRILNAAVIAPSAQYIAVVGFCDETERTVLRLLNAGGKLLASMPLEHGGTGSSTRWSSDSKLVGTVTKGEFRIYSVPDLTPYVTFTEQYPSDLAFIGGCKEMVLGTWNYGRIVQLPRPVE